jgi:transcriptional antiterminator RfaH
MGLRMNEFVSSDRRWYVIYTRPKFEKKAFKSLTEKGILSYLPLKKTIRQWHDRKKKIEVPVFPNYIFVQINESEVPGVYSLPGFVRFVSTGRTPDVIPQKKMDMIKVLLNGEFETSTEEFEARDCVQVLSGPFKDLKGVLIGDRGNRRFAVKLEAINQYIIANIAPIDLMKLNYEMVEA